MVAPPSPVVALTHPLSSTAPRQPSIPPGTFVLKLANVKWGSHSLKMSFSVGFTICRQVRVLPSKILRSKNASYSQKNELQNPFGGLLPCPHGFLPEPFFPPATPSPAVRGAGLTGREPLQQNVKFITVLHPHSHLRPLR